MKNVNIRQTKNCCFCIRLHRQYQPKQVQYHYPPKAPNSRARVHRNVDNFFILIMFFVVVIFKVQRYYMLSQFIFKNVAQIV